MRIRTLYDRPGPLISFEYFPPKTPEAEETLVKETTPALLKFKPGFISVTLGAGGGTRDSSLRVASRVRQMGAEVLSHLTCVGWTKSQIGAFLDEAKAQGVDNILALRGDPPKGQATFQANEGGFTYANELIHFIRQRDGFCIGAACFPEGHVECWNKRLDWEWAAAKVEAGAEFLISQFFYDWSDFLDMTDFLRQRLNVTAPIVPGILPFLSAEQIKRFTALCGAKLPGPLLRKLESYGDDESVRQFGVEVCTTMCEKLLQSGVPGFHFYCLNRTASCTQILRNLGLAP